MLKVCDCSFVFDKMKEQPWGRGRERIRNKILFLLAAMLVADCRDLFLAKINLPRASSRSMFRIRHSCLGAAVGLLGSGIT